MGTCACKAATDQKAKAVREIFNRVAARYDLLNDLLSFGEHRLWKRHLKAEAAVRPGMRILDIAGGTGDIVLRLAPGVGASGRVWLTDINEEMLAVGRHRVAEAGIRCHSAVCNAEALPFVDGAFDVVTVAFGLRNMTHKDVALSEMARVLKPGGRVLVLEFSRCWKWVAPVYHVYLERVLPRIAGWVCGDSDSYVYLAESIRKHPPQAEIARMMREAGFQDVVWHDYCFGVCALHVGTRAA